MDTLDNTRWDVVISGTGLPQSLLALALSRSGKKILHVDGNKFYGGPDAALSLQEAEYWVSAVNGGQQPQFSGAKIATSSEHAREDGAKLGFSRAYSLSLSPQIIYSRSAILATLVSSKIYRHLEFQAVGSWWVLKGAPPHSEQQSSSRGRQLKRIPNGREDVFKDKTISLQAKRSLMRFLKVIADADTHDRILEENGAQTLQDYLMKQWDIHASLQPALYALTMSPDDPSTVTVAETLPRIIRHLSSIGVFGPGFGSVVPKWGGNAEISQVANRACAVGGGVYVLGKSIAEIEESGQDAGILNLHLSGNEHVQTDWLVASANDDIMTKKGPPEAQKRLETKMISLIASPLTELFPPLPDGGPFPAVTMVVVPARTLEFSGMNNEAPIYLSVHSSDTGECPVGQCSVYSSIANGDSASRHMLELATQSLVDSIHTDPPAQVLWRLSFIRSHSQREVLHRAETSLIEGKMIGLNDTPMDTAFDDRILREVRTAWQMITGETEGFMTFDDKDGTIVDDD